MGISACNQRRDRGYSRKKGGGGSIFRWISRLVILPRLTEARPREQPLRSPNRITPRGWCMIVPAKKLNVHLINRVGGSDCVRGGKGSEKVGWTMPVVEWCVYMYIYIYIVGNSTYHTFRFSSEIHRPAGSPCSRCFSTRSRSYSFDHTFRKSLKPFSTLHRWNRATSRPNFTILKLTFLRLQIYPSRRIHTRYIFPNPKEKKIVRIG